MKFDNFSEFKFVGNPDVEYLSCTKLSDFVDTADKKFYIATLFAFCVNNFQPDVVTINEPLKYVNGQKIIAQELHLLKTPEAEAILRNDFKAWKDVKWEGGDSLKSLLVKLGYGKEEIVEMLKEF